MEPIPLRMGYRLLFAGGYRRRKHIVNLQGIIKLNYRQMNEQLNVAVRQQHLHPDILFKQLLSDTVSPVSDKSSVSLTNDFLNFCPTDLAKPDEVDFFKSSGN
ncbi:hypothetical protein OUZ56_018563 [Daphnia magna]|uniref:Uncharacterized protein n=1 Tax=Daphnia magna TaxID=35525 RepID=A0ABQ9Z9B3_9CRUS|nr:hypothetical protein OUZ56_018563 [Daphnia magna]